MICIDFILYEINTYDINRRAAGRGLRAPRPGPSTGLLAGRHQPVARWGGARGPAFLGFPAFVCGQAFGKSEFIPAESLHPKQSQERRGIGRVIPDESLHPNAPTP